MFTNKKRAGINTFVCGVSLYVAETPKPSIKDHEPAFPILPFGIVAYGFVGQPFSKQLYNVISLDHAFTYSKAPLQGADTFSALLKPWSNGA